MHERNNGIPEEAPLVAPNGSTTSRVMIVRGPIARDGTFELCERARLLLEASGDAPLTCDVRELRDPDDVTLDALARLQLTARRLGRSLELCNANAKLRDLLDLAGLRAIVPVSSILESIGQPEQREQFGIDEEVDPADGSR
ncbi:MAG: STAS domain-containing protein [Actinomycetota bacterium]